MADMMETVPRQSVPSAPSTPAGTLAVGGGSAAGAPMLGALAGEPVRPRALSDVGLRVPGDHAVLASDPRTQSLAQKLSAFEERTELYRTEISDLKDRLIVLRLLDREHATPTRLREVCTAIVSRERALAQLRARHLLELSIDLSLGDIGLGTALSLHGAAGEVGDERPPSVGGRSVPPLRRRSSDDTPAPQSGGAATHRLLSSPGGFLVDKWQRLVSALRKHRSTRSAVDEAFVMEVHSTSRLEDLENQKLKIRAALVQLNRSKTENHAGVQELREKLQHVQERIAEIKAAAGRQRSMSR